MPPHTRGFPSPCLLPSPPSLFRHFCPFLLPSSRTRGFLRRGLLCLPPPRSPSPPESRDALSPWLCPSAGGCWPSLSRGCSPQPVPSSPPPASPPPRGTRHGGFWEKEGEHVLESTAFFFYQGAPGSSLGACGAAEAALAFSLARCQMQLHLAKLLTQVPQESW